MTPAQSNPSPERRSYLLRAAADEQLAEAERAELDALLRSAPEDQALIDFERRLRLEVGRTLTVDEPSVRLEHAIQRLARPLEPARRVPRSVLAIAAALVAVLTGIWLFWRSNPDEFGFRGRGSLVRFLTTHQNDCPISIERTLEEFRVEDYGGALSELGHILGQAPDLARLEDTGLVFHGMGRCGIPGLASSMHIVFVGASGSRFEGAMLSVYVQPDDGRLPLEEERTYRLEPKEEHSRAVEMFVWKRAGLDYFVVTPHIEASQAVLASVGAPPVSGVL